MDSQDKPASAEAELESFRQRWREEVSARAKGKAPVASAAPARTAGSSASKPHASKGSAPDAASHSHARQRSVEEVDEVIPYAHQDLGEKQHGRRLDETSAQSAAIASASKEPKTALDHYEKAVERETQGNLGDSVMLYRKAFKLDDGVHEKYKAKHFPPSFFKNKPKPQPQEPSNSTKAPKSHDLNPSNAPAPVPSTAHHSLHGLSPSLQTLLAEFSTLSITGESPPTDLSPTPPCPIASLPEEILVQILEHLAVQDLAAFVRLAQVCKRLAYIVNTEDQVWKRLALGKEYGFAAMHYSYTCQIDGRPLGDDDEGGFILGDGSDAEETSPPTPPSELAITQTLVPSPYPTYRTLFHRRPRIRFNGCYISTVNYQRAGAASTMSLTWGSPIHIVTYYRYLRFLRDGTCISLLTTSEPADVVPYLYIEHMHRNHGNLPSAPMKDALLGRWRLTGPEASGVEDGEKEGTLIIETAGATPKYFNKMMLSLSSAGRQSKNNKLTWQGYWSYNRLTDDWGEFGLKNDRAFYWSRVKSYGMSWDEGGRKDM